MRYIAAASCTFLATLLFGCSDEPADVATAAATSGNGGATTTTVVQSAASTSSSTTGAGGSTTEPIYPDPDWAEGSPSDYGFDPVALDAAATLAGELESYCLLVIKNGVLIAEHYYQGHNENTAQKSFSVAKAYASTLVGIAVERGDIASLDEPVSTYVDEWKGTPNEAITIREILSMTSGLEWSLWDDYVSLVTFSDDHSAFAIGLQPAEPPGTSWTYNNGAVQILEPLFRGATGMTIEQYAAEHLWTPIGMQASWAHDPAGNPTVYASVLSSCRDHARFGYLYLRNGHWKDEQIVPESYVSEALTPSQSFNRAYGYFFWLNGETPALDPMMEPLPGRLAPNAPTDLIGARGFGNQFVDVLPSQDLVVVRFGTDPLGTFDFDELFADAHFEKHDAILGAVLDAMVE